MIRISDLETGQLVKLELDSQVNSEVVIIGEIQNIYKTLMFGVDYCVITIKLDTGELRKVHQSEICSLEVVSKDNVITEEQFYCTAGEIIAKDRKSTRLNSSHANISYAVFCL